MSVDARFSPVTRTRNDLRDVVGFVKNKNVVALHTTELYRIFHDISFEQPENVTSLRNVRVVYLDCTLQPSVLDKGEWDDTILGMVKNAKEVNVESKMGKAIIARTLVPNKECISLTDKKDNLAD